MGITLNRFGKQEKKESLKVKSILKGFPNEDEPKERTMDSSNNMSSMVAVTVNNFMQTEKKQEQPQTYNNRPYSSDNKERKANPYDIKPNRLFAYDNPITTNIKTAYDNKIMSKIGTNTTNINKNSKKP